MHLKHMTYYIKDLNKSVEFYETMAELKVDRRIPSGQAEIAFLHDCEGATQIELIQSPNRKPYAGGGESMFLCFATDKLEAMHGLAQEKGYNPTPIQQAPNTRYFYMYDPDGISVQLREF